jgi:hypothetical protein
VNTPTTAASLLLGGLRCVLVLRSVGQNLVTFRRERAFLSGYVVLAGVDHAGSAEVDVSNRLRIRIQSAQVRFGLIGRVGINKIEHRVSVGAPENERGIVHLAKIGIP